ncbi:MAG: hypothetical protein RL141_1140 [Candidatus Parcubacteria bacterium]|jgi:hypothetical protein
MARNPLRIFLYRALYTTRHLLNPAKLILQPGDLEDLLSAIKNPQERARVLLLLARQEVHDAAIGAKQHRSETMLQQFTQTISVASAAEMIQSALQRWISIVDEDLPPESNAVRIHAALIEEVMAQSLLPGEHQSYVWDINPAWVWRYIRTVPPWEIGSTMTVHLLQEIETCGLISRAQICQAMADKSCNVDTLLTLSLQGIVDTFSEIRAWEVVLLPVVKKHLDALSSEDVSTTPTTKKEGQAYDGESGGWVHPLPELMTPYMAMAVGSGLDPDSVKKTPEEPPAITVRAIPTPRPPAEDGADPASRSRFVDGKVIQEPIGVSHPANDDATATPLPIPPVSQILPPSKSDIAASRVALGSLPPVLQPQNSETTARTARSNGGTPPKSKSIRTARIPAAVPPGTSGIAPTPGAAVRRIPRPEDLAPAMFTSSIGWMGWVGGGALSLLILSVWLNGSFDKKPQNTTVDTVALNQAAMNLLSDSPSRAPSDDTTKRAVAQTEEAATTTLIGPPPPPIPPIDQVVEEDERAFALAKAPVPTSSLSVVTIATSDSPTDSDQPTAEEAQAAGEKGIQELRNLASPEAVNTAEARMLMEGAWPSFETRQEDAAARLAIGTILRRLRPDLFPAGRQPWLEISQRHRLQNQLVEHLRATRFAEAAAKLQTSLPATTSEGR